MADALGGSGLAAEEIMDSRSPLIWMKSSYTPTLKRHR
jgi:hypothetical protein